MNEQAGERANEAAHAEDTSRHLSDPVRELDLEAEARGLREDEVWQREGPARRCGSRALIGVARTKGTT